MLLSFHNDKIENGETRMSHECSFCEKDNPNIVLEAKYGGADVKVCISCLEDFVINAPVKPVPKKAIQN